jgi:hypothetical protein
VTGVRGDTVWGPGKKFLRIELVGTPIKTLDTLLVASRPTIFHFRNNKLWGVQSNGGIYRGKGFVYSWRRKYLLFGKHYFNRRNPLVKRRAKDIA